MTRLLPILLLLCANAFGATWYVDIGRTGFGNNDGTSWDNAWTNLASVNLASVSDGETVYFSGGTYAGDFRVTSTAGGSEGSPIILKASQEDGHNSKVIFSDTLGCTSGTWFTFDGSKMDGVTYTSTLEVPNVQTNCNWKVKAIIMNSSGGAVGATYKWMEIGDSVTGAAEVDGVLMGTADPDNVVFEYCYWHDVDANGVNYAYNPTWDWNDVIFRWCYMTNTGDDFIEGQPGTTIHNCYLEFQMIRHGHPDGLAGPMGKTLIYNNVIKDTDDRPIYLKIWYYNPDEHNDVYIYGNLLYTDQTSDPARSGGVEDAIQLGWETQQPNVPTDNMFTNIVIANNTIISIGSTTDGYINGHINFVNSNAATNTIHVTNMWIYNNLCYMSPSSGINTKGAAGTGYQYTEDSVRIDYNLVWSTNSNGKVITYTNGSNADAIAFNAATIYDFNRTNAPTFNNISSHDYTLSSSDTGAKDAGTNLISMSLPGWDTDMLGNSRTNDGSVDIGAFEYTPDPGETNLLVWLKFEGDFSDGRVTNYTGNGLDGLRFGKPGTAYPSNFPTQVAISTSPGRSVSGYCADFDWTTNTTYSSLNKEGDYIAITNQTSDYWSRLTNMPEATITVWARYRETTQGADFSAEANTKLISFGGGGRVAGEWEIGRYNTGPTYYAKRTSFQIITNGGTVGRDFYTWFPDECGGIGEGDGDTTNWNHYGVVFSNSYVWLYFNGSLWTNRFIDASADALRPDSYTLNGSWMAIGCSTHSGTPSLDEGEDDYPNHGWMNGSIDDIRIYDRTLTASEIAAIYSSELNASATYKIIVTGAGSYIGNIQQ